MSIGILASLSEHVGFLLAIIYAVMIITTIFVVILDKSDSTKALMWVFVLVMLPVVGFVLYLFLGRNFRHRSYLRKEPVDLSLVGEASQGALPSGSDPVHLSEEFSAHRHIGRLLWGNSQSPALGGNAVELFQDGPSAFEALIADLESATEFIDMQYYIFCQDEIGGRIADILLARARAGVRVRLIYDDVGSWRLGSKFLRELRDGGVDARAFHRVFVPWLATKLNYRNHRKIVVVDGKYAHMGGMNVADKYVYGDPKLGEWHDTQIRLRGPVVSVLHAVFLSDWQFVSGSLEMERPSVQYPFGGPMPGASTVQIGASGPDSRWASLMQAFFMAITRAKRYIYICTPYFIPNESILTALRTAALSGVDVRLELPSRSDSRMVLYATLDYVHALLLAGIRVYLFEGGFNHSKVMMVDGELAIIGSANMDIRSFETNYEVASFIYDREVTYDLERKFIADCMRSESLDVEEWHDRPLWFHLRNGIARLFSPLF